MLPLPSSRGFLTRANYGFDYLKKLSEYLEQIKTLECCFTNPFMGKWMLQGDGSWKPRDG